MSQPRTTLQPSETASAADRPQAGAAAPSGTGAPGSTLHARRQPDPDPNSNPDPAPAGGTANAPATAAGDEVAISVCQLSKMYRLYPRPSSILREIITRRSQHEEHWVLRDVSFNIRRGEIVGIVGANGAGKSTLLRILAGVLDPTSGAYVVNGQLRAILQLGTGFHPQYTGRENIYMSGLCLGFSREQIDESLESIIDFSGIRPAIDRPVRTYSSGMLARLMFSVTFCRKPEILIVDEALATGDLAFNQKCVNRIVELCTGGSTALIVSHSMYFIETLCSRALYLRDGMLAEDGPCRKVTRRFERELLDRFAQDQERERAREKQAEAGSLPSNPPVITASSPKAGPATSAAGQIETAGRPPEVAAPATPPPPPLAPPPSLPPARAHDDPAIAALLDDPRGECPEILHLNLVRLVEARVLNRLGNRCDTFHTGDPLAIEIEVDSDVHKEGIAVGVQVHHEAGTHVLTSTNLVHLTSEGQPRATPMTIRRGRNVFRVDFGRLWLSDGKYFVSVGLSPKLKHFTPADQLMRENRVAVFSFYRADTPWKTIYDPPSSWTNR